MCIYVRVFTFVALEPLLKVDSQSHAATSVITVVRISTE